MRQTPEAPEFIILQNIKTILTEFVEQQKDDYGTGVFFNVFLDRQKKVHDSVLPAVCIYIDESSPDSGTQKYKPYSVTISFDLYVNGVNSELENADAVAAHRLYYLFNQLRDCLFATENYYLGLSNSQIAKRGWLNFQRKYADRDSTEKSYCSAVCSMTVDFAVEGFTPDYLDLEELEVNTDDFDLLYNYE